MRQDRAETVARAAEQALEAGLEHGPDVEATIESTAGGAGSEDLAGLLADRDGADAAPLVELLLSPGEDVLVRLEPVLERAGLTGEEADAAGEALARRAAGGGLRTVAALPGGARAEIGLRPEDARTFVRRLRPDRGLPAELAGLLGSPAFREAPNLAVRLKVRLRHSRPAWNRARTSFAARLLGGLAVAEGRSGARDGSGTGDWLETLDWTLAFLDALPPDEPPLAGLGLRYRATLEHLHQAERVQDMLARNNVETLRMQGLVLSLPHPDVLRTRLDRIDRVCRAVTGRPASAMAEPAVSEQDLGGHADPAGLIEAMRRTGG